MKNKFRQMALMQAMVAASMMGADGMEREEREDVSKAPPREYHGWDNIQLTKAERKGKTYEEMQAMRKDRWIEAHR